MRVLRIGIQWNTQVTLKDSQHLVSQVYCSALPIAYTNHDVILWETFARLVLEASYETTILAGILNARGNGSNAIFLALLGGGAFGNPTDWIIGGIHSSKTARVTIAYKESATDQLTYSSVTADGFVRRFFAATTAVLRMITAGWVAAGVHRGRNDRMFCQSSASVVAHRRSNPSMA